MNVIVASRKEWHSIVFIQQSGCCESAVPKVNHEHLMCGVVIDPEQQDLVIHWDSLNGQCASKLQPIWAISFQQWPMIEPSCIWAQI